MLTLSPMDELVFHLDTPRFPWTIELEIRAPGRIDPARLRVAVRAAMAAHPMARAGMRSFKATDRRYGWDVAGAQEVDGLVDPVTVAEAPTDAAMAALRNHSVSTGVALDAPPPFRVVLARRPAGDSLLLVANHVATDGMGALRLLRSILHAYAGRPDPVPDVDPAVDCDVRRVAGATSPLDRFGRVLGYGGGLRHAHGRLARIAIDGGEPGAEGFALHHLVIGSHAFAEVDRHRHATATVTPTVNDVLLAALHLTIADWNADHLAETDRVTVMMPMNMRPRGAWTETMANLSMMAQVHTTPAHRRDASAMVRAVAEQTALAKRSGSATVLLEVLDRSHWLPSIAKRAIPMLSPLSNDAFVDTAVLSNLGRIDEAFDFGAGPDGGRATELWFSPPARMPLGVGVGAATLDGALHLSFRACRAQFDAPAAAAFADRFCAALAFVS